MSELGKRIRWKPFELTLLANEMARLMRDDAKLSVLKAVRAAQPVLDEDRRRDIGQWSMVEEKLAPELKLAQERLDCGAAAASGAEGEALEEKAAASSAAVMTHAGGERLEAGPTVAMSTGGEAIAESGGRSSEEPAAAALVAQEVPGERVKPGQRMLDALRLGVGQGVPDALQLEAVLLVALQSPVVERALEELVTKTMANALARVANGEVEQLASSSRSKQQKRVLVAGFSGSQAKGMSSGLGSDFEVRIWTPGQSHQMVQASAKICEIAVIPEDAPDELGEFLREQQLTVIRHEGSVTRLAERLSAVE